MTNRHHLTSLDDHDTHRRSTTIHDQDEYPPTMLLDGHRHKLDAATMLPRSKSTTRIANAMETASLRP